MGNKVKVKTVASRPLQKASASRWHLALIIGLAFVAYANALTAGFVWDDELQIVKNWQIRDITNAGAVFSSAFWAFADPEAGGHTNFYRPVQSLTYMVAYQIGGLSPWSYHLFNIGLHALAAIFL